MKNTSIYKWIDRRVLFQNATHIYEIHANLPFVFQIDEFRYNVIFVCILALN